MAYVMDQISRPLLIALVAIVGLAGVWMTVLRPRAQSGGDSAAPAATGAASSAAPSAGPPAEAAPAPTGTIVLLFAGRGADDDAARAVVRGVKRSGIRTIIAPIERVGDYKDLTGSVEIPAAPTILVIGPDRRAQRIVGLPDALQVEQALRAAG